MEINYLSGRWRLQRRLIAKTFLIMKLIAFLLLVACLQVSATGNSQTITLSEKNAPLPKVFKSIEKQTKYVFFFDMALVEGSKKVTLQFSNATIDDVLQACFKDQPLTYAIVGNIIVIHKKNADPQIAQANVPAMDPITGRVLNDQGQPLTGASVMLKSKNTGTSTDADGRFSIEAVRGEILVVSYVGFEQKEVAVGSRTSIEITLTPDQKSVEEVVVIAYGKVRKSDLTGSVSHVKGTDLNSFPTTNVIQAMSGRAAGVRVMQNNGTPGSPVSVRIRGANSILGGNEPLYIIDGFPSSPTYLQSADIESMEILKDASSTAMYGSRGGNGVVLITTHSGRKNQATKVNADMGYSTQSITKKMKLLNPFQYASLYNEQAKNDNMAPYFSQQQLDAFQHMPGTDWQDLLLRKAPLYSGNVSVTGGSEKTTFYLSGGVFSQEGIIPNSDYNRYSFRVNINHEISKIFSVGYTSIYTRSDRSHQNSSLGNRGSDMFGAMLFAPPTVGPYDANGRYVRLNTVYPFISNAIVNPVARRDEMSNKTQVDDIVANLNLRIKPGKDLEFRLSANILNSNNRNDAFTNREPYALNSTGTAYVGTSQFTSLLNENIVSYKKTIADKHTLDVVAGIANQLDKNKSMASGNASVFLSNTVYTGSLQSAGLAGLPTSGFSKNALSSFIGRVNYGFDNRYLFTISFRRDGYSAYSKEFRWENFPSAAIAWRVSNENFLQNSSIVSDLKLRASYGRTGNTSIGPYQSLNILQPYNTIFGDALTIGYAPRAEYTGNLQWEKTDQMDVGVDAALLNNKVRITADYYYKRTKALLNKVQLPTSFGYETALQNVGEISNRGVEIGIDATVVDNHDWKWTLGGNIAFNRNKVEKLYKGQDIVGPNIFTGNINDYINLLREGEAVFVFYGYKEIGYTDKGLISYEDKNPDGAINALDRSIIGDPNPDFIYGLNSFTRYKDFELTLFFQGSQGNDLFNLNKASTLDMGWGLNQPEDVYTDHWTTGKTNAKYPKPSNKINGNFSTRFVEDGSYLKLKNIMLSYSLPVKNWKINYLKSAQFYVSGQNLVVLTNYSGYDPEVNAYGSANSLVQGVDYTVYPPSKSITFGIRCTF
ncbi:TonB-dependent receptor [Niastella populi]|nr:TonB-dependent receptor [Niastella populi]